MISDRCYHCGKIIYLVKIRGTQFRWLTNPKRLDSWNCGGNPHITKERYEYEHNLAGEVRPAGSIKPGESETTET